MLVREIDSCSWGDVVFSVSEGDGGLATSTCSFASTAGGDMGPAGGGSEGGEG